MKKFKAMLVFALGIYAGLANAQTNTFPPSGNVGVGTISPASNLEINEPSDSKPDGIVSPSKSILKLSRAGTANYSYTEAAEFRIAHGGPGFWGSRLDLYVNGPSNQTNIPDQHAMTWQYNGNVGIGTTLPQEKLSVNGNIRAKEIKVETANWPDYVFEADYEKLSLAEVEKYIRSNKRLPEVPSAKEAQENGIELGEMNKILLKKIEELTLHLIEKDKQMTTQQDRFKQLETRIFLLEQK